MKSLMVSQLVYILSPLPTDHEAVKEVNNLFYNFLWGGRVIKSSVTSLATMNRVE